MNEQNYIFTDFVPYQESKTSVGVNIYRNHSNVVQKSFLLSNWFTNNLFVNGSISSIENSNDIELKYNTSIGYAYNIDYRIVKNMIFILGYNRIRFRNSELDNINMSYNLLFNMKFKAFWASFSYGVINHDNKIESFSINFLRSISDLFILTIGAKYIINYQDELITPYFSLRYKI